MPKVEKGISDNYQHSGLHVLEIASLQLISHNGELQRLWISGQAHRFMAKVWVVAIGEKILFSK